MITIYNNLIPFKGYKAMCVYPFLFVRKTANITDTDINHEKIHGEQQKEVLVVFALLLVLAVVLGLLPWWLILVSPLAYFTLYGLEYAVRLCLYGFNHPVAYKNISFEQEAYAFQGDANYLNTRNAFAFVKFLFKKTYS